MEFSKVITAAIIGYGLSGKVFHGPFLKALEGFEVKYILTRDPKKQSDAAIDFPNANIVDTELPIWNDESIELVVIATPNVEHFRLASTAMNLGKHVVVEKPFTVNSDEARTLETLAKEKGVSLSVYQNRRWDGDFKTVSELIHSGRLGRLVQFESHFDRFRPEFKENAWREKALPGSGILFDLGSHLIDQALCLFGRPLSLYADVSSERLGEVDDAFTLLLYYENLKVTLRASTLIKEPTPRFALYGTDGAYVKYGLDPQEDALRAGEPFGDGSQKGQLQTLTSANSSNDPLENRPSKDQAGILNTSSEKLLLATKIGSYQDFYLGVYKSIVEKTPPPVSATEGLAVIEIIEAAMKSHTEGRRVDL